MSKKSLSMKQWTFKSELVSFIIQRRPRSLFSVDSKTLQTNPSECKETNPFFALYLNRIEEMNREKFVYCTKEKYNKIPKRFVSALKTMEKCKRKKKNNNLNCLYFSIFLIFINQFLTLVLKMCCSLLELCIG